MADSQLPGQKRIGNYVPERIRVLEKEIAERYAVGESLRGIAKALDINKAVVRRVALANGIEAHDKAAAGKARRQSYVADDDPIQQQSVSDFVYAQWSNSLAGSATSRKVCHLTANSAQHAFGSIVVAVTPITERSIHVARRA